MAQMIDCAAIAAQHMSTAAQVSILPPERVCSDGDTSWRIDEFVDPKEDREKHFVFMQLTVIDDGIVNLRIHTCPVCGTERRYGGRS